MKMEKAIQNLSTPKDTHVTLEILHLRMATELCELAGICKDVEDALGEIIEQPNKPLERPVITLQGLDRLRQSLEDVARLSNFLSQSQNTGPLESISVKAIRKNIVLAGLAERLTRSAEISAIETDTDHDVIWG
ncbi:MAG: hypothetical protein KAT26_08775 [Marinosulfonomonas sp.]|nr:hypothetical protein [Marinosulfonomonas sp.]